jgi:rubredoxin
MGIGCKVTAPDPNKKIMTRKPLIKINLPGGIAAAGDVYAWMSAAENCGVSYVQPGNRQQLYFTGDTQPIQQLARALQDMHVSFEQDRDSFPNILTSYVTEDVFQSGNWLSEGLYKDILGLFDYKPTLKVSLVDAQQTFIPFFTGNINFISSPVNNYWYLYIRFRKTTLTYAWKGLIYSDDIPRISKLIEAAMLANPDNTDGQLLENLVREKENFIMQPVTAPLQVPDFELPYYEGFNRYGQKNWLGIYRRDERFPVQFLRDAAALCLQTKVGQLYTTPWKSLVIKGIAQENRPAWDFLLNKYRINLHHAANELNWQIEDLDEEGLQLKRYLVRQFDKEDIRTQGLCFAIKTKPHSGLFGAVVIRKQQNTSRNQRKALDRYDILYTRDFNPNSREYILFRRNVPKENLATYLMALCKYYYEIRTASEEIKHSVYREQEAQELQQVQQPVITRYQCPHCLSLYDETYGDPAQQVAPGTPWEQLPETWQCNVCETPKAAFIAVQQSTEAA